MATPYDIANWNLKGAAAATTIIATWSASLVALLSLDLTGPYVWLAPIGVVAQTFLYTGLFITAHDAMHGSVVPANRRVNDLIGTLAVRLYALFSFEKLHGRHWEHHDHPGEPGADPDFHDGEHRGFFRWYANFLMHYVTVFQIVGMAIVFNVLHHLVGVALPNLLLFWVAPALLSTFQLFYFGTFLPHREPHEPGNAHHARSNDFTPFWSFITCYHFGYHLEHHEYPGVPWWHLPAVRGVSDDAEPTPA
jgi:beta-carotene ketolase (CrtW type)